MRGFLKFRCLGPWDQFLLPKNEFFVFKRSVLILRKILSHLSYDELS
jgi:hypothetical protein